MVVGSIFPGLYPGIYCIGLGRDVPGQDQERRGGLYPGQLCSMMLRYFCSFLSGWVLWASFNETADMQGFIATFFPALGNLSGTALAGGLLSGV